MTTNNNSNMVYLGTKERIEGYTKITETYYKDLTSGKIKKITKKETYRKV